MAAGQRAVGQVHGRRAGEAGHEHRCRAVVDGVRRVVLHQPAAAEHGDAVGQGHGLDLIVRDVDDGRAQALVQAFDFAAHLVAQLGVEVGERLVEQKHLGLAHDRAADGHALALAAAERGRPAVEHVVDAQQLGGVGHAALDVRFRRAAQAQPEGHVLVQRLVRVERVVLEHHRDVAVARRQLVHALAFDTHFAAADGLQPRDHAQQRALAAAAGAHEDDELAVADLKVDAVDHVHRPVALGHRAQFDVGHQ
jgi:hypothetical protein